jgi:hypothetical protein
MHRSVLSVSMLLFAGAALHAQPFGFAQGQQQQPPQPAPVNLQVLPKDMSRPEVVQTMRTFTRALGVRCQHCHVGEGNDLSKFDFASDEKPTKKIARAMLTMVMDINTTHLAGIGEPAPAAPGEPPALKVTCFTCHRGETMPLSAPPPREGRGGGARVR